MTQATGLVLPLQFDNRRSETSAERRGSGWMEWWQR